MSFSPVPQKEVNALQALQTSLKQGSQDTLKMLDRINPCNLIPTSACPSGLLTTLTETSMLASALAAAAAGPA